MKVKRIVIFCLIWAVLALLCCAVFYQSAAVFHFTYINRVLDTENYSIVVDDDNTTITILRLDSNHQAVSKIEYEKVSQNRFNLPLRLFQDGDNTYLCNFQNEIGSTEAYYTLYLLDFEHQEMQLCWNYYPGSYMEEVSQLGTVQDQSLIQVTVEDGVVQMVLCVYFEGDENAHYLTYQIQENGCVLISDQAYYESTMSFGRAFSTQSGMVILNDYAYVYCGDQQINDDKYSRLFLSLDGTLFGVNRSKQCLDVIDPALATAYPWEEADFDGSPQDGLSFSALRTVDIQDSNNYLVGYYDEDNCQLLVCQDGEQTVLDRVGMMSGLEFRLWCLLVIAIVGAIEFGLWLFVRYLRRYASVTMKIVATVIPLALVCSMGFILVISALVDQNNRAQTNQSMESVARSVDAAGWIDGITDYHNTVEGLPLDDPQMLEFLLALQGINLTQNQNIQYTDTQQQVQTLTNHSMYSISFFGKDQTNGKYYCLFGDLMMNYYLEDISGFEEVQQVYRILESRQPQPITLYDILGQHLSCICYPVVQDNGQVTGFYLVEASQPESDSTLYLLLGWLALYEFVLSVAVVLLFSLIVFFSFKPMARLRRKAQILMGGNLPKADLVLKKNMDEISELSLTFQELSQQVGANMARMTQLQQLSQAYFSQYILELFGKSSVAQLNFEESLTCPLYCASLRWDPGTLEFDQIHRRVRDLSGFLADCHGFFGSITGEEIHLLSRQKGLFQVAAFAAQEYPDFRVVFDYVPVTVQILGRYPEYRFGIVPEQENRYDLLCNYSDTLNCRLLASQTSFRPEDTSLFFRCVGVVDGQRLYEFFFDLQDSGYKISQTCLEQGVDYYVQGRWKQARNLFVQALQWEPEDRAAKYYIDLIDRQQNG